MSRFLTAGLLLACAALALASAGPTARPKGPAALLAEDRIDALLRAVVRFPPSTRPTSP